jgi:hypothetical protein
MKRHNKIFNKIHLVGLAFILLLTAFISVPAYSCTIFVLTNGQRVLFCNNEDWSNPKTRIWFITAGNGHYGCAYVGFDDGWAQGGMNTKGLAFDWVAGYMEKWKPNRDMKSVRGNPSERMLETCATIEEAIAFYRTHREPSFSRAKILIADRTGASVIIGVKDGYLQFEKASQSRGFGYRGAIAETMLAKSPEPAVANCAIILRACLQKGQYATKYSNVFDLKSGNIFIFQFPEREDTVNLNLANELRKSSHYYDMARIHQQLTQSPIPLLNNMKRFFLDEFKPIADKEPNITSHIRTMIQDVIGGIMKSNDYTIEFWTNLSSTQKEIQSDLKQLGDFISLTLVGRKVENEKRSYRYLLEFKNATALQQFILDKDNKVARMQSEYSEFKPDMTDVED